MVRNNAKECAFFEMLCELYYEKILHYLFAKLRDEAAARDCVQDVFLVALQKSTLLRQHPNPGGFLFQTAKNLVKKKQRESLRQLLYESRSLDGDGPEGALSLPAYDVESMLDRQISEQAYIDAVLSQLTQEKYRLYCLHYLEKKPMAEIAALLGVEEAAIRMRYVRLRREIRTICARLAEEYFIS